MSLYVAHPTEGQPIVDLSPPRGTFGLGVVALAEKADFQRQHSSGDLALATFSALDAELQKTRATLAELPPDGQARFASYVSMVMPDRLAPVAPDDHTGAVRHLLAAQDAQFMTFLRRHVGLVVESQVDSLLPVSAAQQRFIAHTLRGIEDGWVSPEAVRATEDILRRPVRVGDYWTTHQQRMGGYFDVEKRALVIPQGLGSTRQQRAVDLEDNIYWAFNHEGGHAEFEDKFYPDLTSMTLWFREAMAEHLNQSFRDGQPDAIASYRREVDSGGYTELRSFVDFVLTVAPNGPIHPFFVTRGYTSDSFQSHDWMAMEREFDTRWGATDAFWKICRRFEHHMQEAAKDNSKPSWFDVWNEAARLTRADLERQPAVVFAEAHKNRAA